MKNSPWLIKANYFGKLKPKKKIYMKNKGFLRKTFYKDWTVGYSIQGGALLQFTKDTKYGKHFIFNLWVFSFSTATRPGKSEGYRTWINFGWKQGSPDCFRIMKLRFDNMMVSFSEWMTSMIDGMVRSVQEENEKR